MCAVKLDNRRLVASVQALDEVQRPPHDQTETSGICFYAAVHIQFVTVSVQKMLCI